MPLYNFGPRISKRMDKQPGLAGLLESVLGSYGISSEMGRDDTFGMSDLKGLLKWGGEMGLDPVTMQMLQSIMPNFTGENFRPNLNRPTFFGGPGGSNRPDVEKFENPAPTPNEPRQGGDVVGNQNPYTPGEDGRRKPTKNLYQASGVNAPGGGGGGGGMGTSDPISGGGFVAPPTVNPLPPNVGGTGDNVRRYEGGFLPGGVGGPGAAPGGMGGGPPISGGGFVPPPVPIPSGIGGRGGGVTQWMGTPDFGGPRGGGFLPGGGGIGDFLGGKQGIG